MFSQIFWYAYYCTSTLAVKIELCMREVLLRQNRRTCLLGWPANPEKIGYLREEAVTGETLI
jgi:hypothetical protein